MMQAQKYRLLGSVKQVHHAEVLPAYEQEMAGGKPDCALLAIRQRYRCRQ